MELHNILINNLNGRLLSLDFDIVKQPHVKALVVFPSRWKVKAKEGIECNFDKDRSSEHFSVYLFSCDNLDDFITYITKYHTLMKDIDEKEKALNENHKKMVDELYNQKEELINNL